MHKASDLQNAALRDVNFFKEMTCFLSTFTRYPLEDDVTLASAISTYLSHSEEAEGLLRQGGQTYRFMPAVEYFKACEELGFERLLTYTYEFTRTNPEPRSEIWGRESDAVLIFCEVVEGNVNRAMIAARRTGSPDTDWTSWAHMPSNDGARKVLVFASLEAASGLSANLHALSRIGIAPVTRWWTRFEEETARETFFQRLVRYREQLSPRWRDRLDVDCQRTVEDVYREWSR